MKENSLSLGTKIQELREKASLSQKELGILIGRRTRYIKHVEEGEIIPEGVTLIKICQAVNGINTNEAITNQSDEIQDRFNSTLCYLLEK